MKTPLNLPTARSIFLVILICSAFIIGCEEDSFFTETKTLDKIEHSKSGKKIKVKPSYAVNPYIKAEEDWNNINDALQNAKPGEVVQLSEGLFYLHKSIIRWDFNGILKGAGKDKTTIQTAPGELFDISKCPEINWPWSSFEGHFVICFPYSSDSEGGTVTVSDLKVHVTEPATPWFQGGNTNNRLQAINVHNQGLIIPGDMALSNKIDLNVNFKNISVVGEEDSKGFLINVGLAAFGASSGHFEAKNCDLTNVSNGINPHVFCGDNSVATIKNCKIENTIIGLYSFLVSNYDIKENEISNVGVIALQLNFPWGVYPFEMPENVYSSIKNNSIQMNTFDPNGPAIFGVRMHNVDVYDNVISGKCGVGITAWGGFLGDYCQNWSIKENNLCELELTHLNLPAGTTIELNNALNSEVKNNANQVVGGASAGDPSNLIGNAVDCP
jgi:hypothetical protein